MLQTAITMGQTASANSRAFGADAVNRDSVNRDSVNRDAVNRDSVNRPAPATQGDKKSEAETMEGFATELSSADILQTQQMQADIALANLVTPEELLSSAPTAGDIDENADSNPQAGSDTIAEEWILNMLGQQTAQLQARELPGAMTNDVQLQELPVITSLTTNTALTEKTTDSKQVQDQQSLLVLNQSQPQKQTQVQSDLVINNTADSKDEQVASNPNTANITEDKTRNVSLVAPPVIERTPNQHIDQTRNAVATLIADRLNGVTPAQTNDNTTNPLSTIANQTLTDGVPDRTLKLHGTEAKWGEQMLHTLRENVNLQLQHRQQNATIRLDPPELGSMEIFLSHESGRLNVQISASQGDVARLLQQTSDRLRQELVSQHFVQVNVQVSSDNQGGQRHSQQRSAQWSEEQITQNHQGTELSSAEKSTAHSGILVTV